MAQITNRGSGGRYYTWNFEGRTERYWSVTTILDLGIPKQALIGWAAKVTAEFAIDHLELVTEMLARVGTKNVMGTTITNQSIAKWLAGQRYDAKQKAADLGSHVHEAIEAHKIGKPYPGVPKAAAMHFDSFLRMLQDQEPEFIAAEANVFNRTRKYAGTLDAIGVWPKLEAYLAERGRDIAAVFPKHCPECEVKTRPGLTAWHAAECVGKPSSVEDFVWYHNDGPVLIGDYKSGGIWPEVALQLSAYSRGEFLGGPEGSELKIPKIDGAIAIRLQPGWAEIIPVDIGDQVFNTFLFAYEIARWQEETSKAVIGKPLAIYELPPGPEDPERLREQIGVLWERLAVAESEAGVPPAFYEASSGRGEDPQRHAVTDPPAQHPSGKRFAALCGGQVAKPEGVPFNPIGRNVCKDCAQAATLQQIVQDTAAATGASVVDAATDIAKMVLPGDHPCPSCGAECEAVEQVEGKRNPRWRCPNRLSCLGNAKGDGPWASWDKNPWVIVSQEAMQVNA